MMLLKNARQNTPVESGTNSPRVLDNDTICLVHPNGQVVVSLVASLTGAFLPPLAAET